jgi:hypothetical protein
MDIFNTKIEVVKFTVDELQEFTEEQINKYSTIKYHIVNEDIDFLRSLSEKRIENMDEEELYWVLNILKGNDSDFHFSACDALSNSDHGYNRHVEEAVNKVYGEDSFLTFSIQEFEFDESDEELYQNAQIVCDNFNIDLIDKTIKIIEEMTDTCYECGKRFLKKNLVDDYCEECRLEEENED